MSVALIGTLGLMVLVLGGTLNWLGYNALYSHYPKLAKPADAADDDQLTIDTDHQGMIL